jgi:hypothetical protein
VLNTCHHLSPPVTYVYLYLRGNGTPYYVGKGSGRRAFAAHGDIPVPADRARILIQFWGSEEEALAAEICHIAMLGRKDLGEGSSNYLYNRTDGGRGAVRRTLKPRKTSAQLIRRLW